MMIENTIYRWHGLLRTRDASGLDDLLHDDCVFHSQVVHTPQEGKEITSFYLSAAMHVLGNEHFEYVREVMSDKEAVLEFVTELDGIRINGVDIIRCDEDGKIVDFKVMIRPLQAVNMIHKMMKAMLESMK